MADKTEDLAGARQRYVAQDADHLPPLTVTQEMVDEAQAEIFGTEIVVSLASNFRHVPHQT